MTDDRVYARFVGIDHDRSDTSLTFSVYTDEGRRVEVLRIAVEDIPDFLRDVVNHGVSALSTAADRLEVGHCETCANTRLVEEEIRGTGRTQRVRCPDCVERSPKRPFRNAPTIGYRDQDKDPR